MAASRCRIVVGCRFLAWRASISAPTLVIHGTADPMFPIEHGYALAEVLPNAHLVAAKGAGHGLESVDQQTVLEAILEDTQ
jgi:pimeloyl-ACP methyl ester carboxylesterase